MASGLDLDRQSPRGIEQTFATVIGQVYAVSFDLPGNREGGSALKSINASVGGVSHNYTFDSTGQTLTTLTWQPVMFSFVAPFASATLVFTSLSDSSSSFGR